jgi:hypothetical protein
MKPQYRQGDVLLCAVEAIPFGAKPVPKDGDRLVVALGELTGHAHALAAAQAQMFREKGSGRSFLVIGDGGAPLSHEENDPILMPAGRYELRRQREYAPQTPRLVGD